MCICKAHPYTQWRKHQVNPFYDHRQFTTLARNKCVNCIAAFFMHIHFGIIYACAAREWEWEWVCGCVNALETKTAQTTTIDRKFAYINKSNCTNKLIFFMWIPFGVRWHRQDLHNNLRVQCIKGNVAWAPSFVYCTRVHCASSHSLSLHGVNVKIWSMCTIVAIFLSDHRSPSVAVWFAICLLVCLFFELFLTEAGFFPYVFYGLYPILQILAENRWTNTNNSTTTILLLARLAGNGISVQAWSKIPETKHRKKIYCMQSVLLRCLCDGHEVMVIRLDWCEFLALFHRVFHLFVFSRVLTGRQRSEFDGKTNYFLTPSKQINRMREKSAKKCASTSTEI